MKLYSGSWVFYYGRLTEAAAQSRRFSPVSDQRFSGHIPLQLTSEATSVMMDCSEEVQSVSQEPSAQMELKKGMSIFIDVSKTMCAHRTR